MNIIAGSFKRNKLIELLELHACVAYSVSYYDVENRGMFSVQRGKGQINSSKIEQDRGLYGIVLLHGVSEESTQPASQFVQGEQYGEFHELWFKGKLEPKEIEKLQFEEDTPSTWEANLLLKHIIRFGSPVDVEGSFACLYSDGKDLYVMRNEFEGMFVDDNMNISTSPFPDSKTLPSNKMFRINFDKKKLDVVEEFITVKRWYPEDK